MATTSERAVALETVGMVTITTLDSFTVGQMPGPSVYVGGLILFGALSLLAAYHRTAQIATYLGGVILVMMLLKPTFNGTPAGVRIASSFANTTAGLGSAPPTYSLGITKTTGTGSGQSSGSSPLPGSGQNWILKIGQDIFDWSKNLGNPVGQAQQVWDWFKSLF